MNKLGFLFFLSIFGCIRLGKLEERDKIFSYDEFRTLVKKEDIAEYLSRNEYDLKQELEQGRDILHILIQKDMEAEELVLLERLTALEEKERVKFLSIGDGKEALFLVVDKLWIKSAMKILEMYSKELRLARLSLGDELNFTLLDRAVMNKNMQSLLLVLDLKREYSREIECACNYEDGCYEYEDNFTFKINKKLSELLEKAYDLVTVRKADKASEVDKSIGEDSIFVTFLKECLKKKGIDEEVSLEDLSNLEEEGKKEALIIASCLGDERVLSYLLNLGVNQDEVDENGNTALIYSSYYGKVEVSKILIEKGEDIDKENNDQLTALILASWAGNKEIVELLVNNKANTNKTYKNGSTALMFASQHGHKEIVEILFDKEEDINRLNNEGYAAIMYASFGAYKEVVELLIKKGASIDLANNYGETSLYIASENGRKKVVELLIEKGATIDLAMNDGETPLYIASQNGRKEIVELLINKGAAIDLADKDGWTPLYIASQNGNKEIVELLINKGAAIDLAMNDGVTPLYIASRNGHKEVVELFISKGAVIDLADKNGCTPLLMASYDGHKAVVELLLSKGASIDLADKDRLTPLYIASCRGHKEVVELLLTKGAAIDLAINNGETSLYIASFTGHKEVVDLLLTKGAAIDLARNDGITPLWTASYNGNKEVVKLLLSKGADINKVNLEGKSVLEAALLNEKEEVIEELLSSCFVEGEGIVLSSNSLIVNKGALNLFNREIKRNETSSIIYFAKVYRMLNEIYIEQFIREVERDFDKSCTTKLVEIMDEVISLNELKTELSKEEVKGINIKNDDSKRTKYEICEMIDNLNKMFNKSRDLKVKPIYDKFKNNREVILNRRVKAGYYKDHTILMLEILKSDLDKVLDKVRELIKQGSDVNAADQNGNSCLALAIRKNLKEVVEELINNGAEINAVNKSGENALMLAIEGNLVDMVKRLAPLTNMNHEDIFKNTAIMLAIKKIMLINSDSIDSGKQLNEMEEIIDILIKSGANVTKEVIDLLKEKKEDKVVEKFRLKLLRIFKLDF